jgi:hypothetical protein
MVKAFFWFIGVVIALTFWMFPIIISFYTWNFWYIMLYAVWWIPSTLVVVVILSIGGHDFKKKR